MPIDVEKDTRPAEEPKKPETAAAPVAQPGAPVAEVQLGKLNLEKLKAKAAELKVNIDGLTTKKQIVAAIEAAQTK